jgi:hypothetical protein
LPRFAFAHTKHIPRKVDGPKHDDRIHPREIESVFTEIVSLNVGVAKAVVGEVAHVANIIRGQISKRR